MNTMTKPVTTFVVDDVTVTASRGDGASAMGGRSLPACQAITAEHATPQTSAGGPIRVSISGPPA